MNEPAAERPAQASPVVVLDACVLYPAPLRDFLMWLATAELFRARWSAEIHDEWIRNVLEQRPDLRREQLERTRALMDAHVEGSLVTGYEPLIDTLHLPDAQDRHVLAAAIHARADVIVTFNLKDFPAHTLAGFGVHAQHPDEFALGLITQHPARILAVVEEHRASLRNPPKTRALYVGTLEKQGLPKTAEQLRALYAQYPEGES
jgi:predicted nucleic acid-binding protein